MAQPSIASYFNARKRSAVDDIKVNRAKKVLVLDSDNFSSGSKGKSQNENIEEEKDFGDVAFCTTQKDKLQKKEEKIVSNKIIINVTEKPPKTLKKTAPRLRNKSISSTSQNIQQFLANMKKPKSESVPDNTVINTIDEEINQIERHITPPTTPRKPTNALDKVADKSNGPSLKEIKRKLTRSARLADLKASIGRFQENDRKLKEIEKKTELIPESPKLNSFRTIELEIQTSPQKVFSPEKSYLSPKKDRTARRNLLPELSPTKNVISGVTKSPCKQILEDISKPSLILPFKYRYLAEMFRAIDVVSQILFNRNEVITFKKLKPAVEEMMKRNLLEKHLGQIKHIYPDAFSFSQEKLKVFGAGVKQEQWVLVVTPKINGADHMNSEMLLQRKRKLFNILLDKVKTYHGEFLSSLDPPMIIPKDQIKRWHPEFNIEVVPDIEVADLPQPPAELKFTTGKDVLEKARQMFNCNTRMEQALQKLKEKKDYNPVPMVEEEPKAMPVSVLKGIPKALLEKVRQRQAAKALISMTRTADKEKEVQMYSRLPEIARLSWNIFVSEKKSVLPLESLFEKLGHCYRTYLTSVEMEEHLQLISTELPSWLIFHNIRNVIYVKLNKNADLSMVINKLELVAKRKSEM